jgi:hypothetical protein
MKGLGRGQYGAIKEHSARHFEIVSLAATAFRRWSPLSKPRPKTASLAQPKQNELMTSLFFKKMPDIKD